MKLFFILLILEPETKTGGFTPEEKAELQKSLGDVQAALETKNRTLIEGEFKKHLDPINTAIKKFGDSFTERDETDKKNQEALDGVLLKMKDLQVSASSGRREAKSLQAALIDAMTDGDNLKAIAEVGRGHRAKIMLKGPIDLSITGQDFYDPTMKHKMEPPAYAEKASTMTAGQSVTGNTQLTYSPRQAILPSQKVNIRDLIPTVRSETGVYVHYKETTPVGSIALQSDGATKSQIEFDFTEVKTVNNYVAGFAKFSKQLMRNLPWLMTTLPRLLQREFFKAENRRFWDIVDTAFTGSAATTETDDVKQVMDWLTNLFDSDFMASYGLMRYTALNRLNKLLYTNGYYQGSGGVVSRPDGSISIMGVPIIPVTWIPSYDKFLTFDLDYMERIEVESLAIEFFEQDDVNVQKNLITARIECFEEFNAMLPQSIVIGDFGNQSLS